MHHPSSCTLECTLSFVDQIRVLTHYVWPCYVQVTQQQGLQWASEAVTAVPEMALGASDRQKLLGVMQVTAIEGPEAVNYR